MKHIKKKIYNKQTGCYKIDIYGSENVFPRKYIYLCSTAQSKTCKQAVEKYKINNIEFCCDKIIMAVFDKR